MYVSRYALTNGKLVIRNPTESKDAGRYICTATNPYGTVISQIGLLSFGSQWCSYLTKIILMFTNSVDHVITCLLKTKSWLMLIIST